MNNREFKFRIWSGEKWLDDAVVLSLKGKLCDMFLYRPNQFEKCIIQQFTGLTDKNGIDIYEGDIVKWRRSYEEARDNIRYDLIEFQDGSFGFLIGDSFHNLRKTIHCELTVIGNIFENPELLTK